MSPKIGPLSRRIRAHSPSARRKPACPVTNFAPALVPIPGWPLRLLLGDFAEELLLSGQRVLPAAALDSGFRFLYPDIDAALAAITGKRPVRAAMPDRASLLQASP